MTNKELLAFLDERIERENVEIHGCNDVEVLGYLHGFKEALQMVKKLVEGGIDEKIA